jgi:hypothetical protein
MEQAIERYHMEQDVFATDVGLSSTDSEETAE